MFRVQNVREQLDITKLTFRFCHVLIQKIQNNCVIELMNPFSESDEKPLDDIYRYVSY